MPREEDRLTDAERERLDLLVEEMGEVAQVVGKIGRHGALSFSPFDPERTTNRQNLEKEVGDLMYTLALMTAAGDLDTVAVQTWMNHKSRAVRPWLHHQDGELLNGLAEVMFPQDSQQEEAP